VRRGTGLGWALWLAAVALRVAAADLDVAQFGAKADGVTDCTPAIQSALDAAVQAGGGRVLIPPAEKPYLVTATLRVTGSNIEIEGDGATLLMADDAVRDSKSHLLFVCGQKDTPVRNVVVRGLALDGNFWNQGKMKPASKPRGLLVEHAEKVRIERVRVRRAWVSLAFGRGARDAEAVECEVSQWHNDGFDAADGATGVRFIRCAARDALSEKAGGLAGGRDGGWEIEDGAQDISLVECLVERTDASAFKVRSHDKASVTRNIRFERCRALAPCRAGWVVSGRDHDTRTEDVTLVDCEGERENHFSRGADRVLIQGGKFERILLQQPKSATLRGVALSALLVDVSAASDGREMFHPEVVLEGVNAPADQIKIVGDATRVKQTPAPPPLTR
jgi:hypothetical protein